MNRNFLIRISFVLFFPLSLLAQGKVTGFVYKDNDGNGLRSKNEPGIAGVPVSNGKDVAVTDKKGRYELPIDDDDIIFVIKPSGYRVPLNELNLPRYYYIHKPKGSPALEFKGVAPTGPLPASVDFALIPQKEPDNFKALVFGDPQVKDETELAHYENDIVSEVKGIKNVAFGLTMGDMVQEDLRQHQDYAAITAKVGIPWYNVCGNHDLNQDCGVDSLNHETFQATFGPADYSFNYGKTHVIVLNDNLYPDPRGNKRGLWAGFRPSQLEFLKNDLRLVDTGKLVVLAFHCPLNIVNENSFREPDRRKFFKILEKYPHVFSIAAHSHQLNQNFFTKEDGWNGVQPYHELDAGATCGNWYSGKVNEKGFLEGMMSNGVPRGYIFLNVTGNKYTTDYKVAGKPADYQIRLYHRKVLTPIWWDGRGSVYANFFMGHKESKLECRIDNGEWKRMRYREDADPYYVSQLFKWDESDTLFEGRRPTEPADCRHLWTAPLPCDLGLGVHQIEVRATDLFGRIFTEKSSYRIEDPK
ncbi:calcineurin-like phosphoesterase C-terminal domain-containing protein [Pararcticibacter amylolyticus]|uniref:Metallophosphoesterase n=1 Tax=Pararcticibacter amylolyticus TaxID=2173175 RepID=A0A2U2PAM4_9SPHI|nr:calcineurin-like phosphoesterase family protein [Pararcticibacter amylolyticus]PWG78179.1 metallophosphoesterase [Pararcticibacter amylolyticus]